MSYTYSESWGRAFSFGSILDSSYYLNFLILIYSDICLCQNFHKCHTLLGKLKCVLLKIWNWYDLLRVEPCERARPQLSEYVWHIMVFIISVSVNCCQSQGNFQKNHSGKSSVTKKRHGHNFQIWGLKRIAWVVNRVDYTGYSFQTSILKIVAVSFFCNASYFC